MDEEFITPNRTAVPGEGRAAREVFWYPAGHLFPVSKRTCLKEVLSEMCLRGRRAEGSCGAARGGHPLLRLQPERSAEPGGGPGPRAPGAAVTLPGGSRPRRSPGCGGARRSLGPPGAPHGAGAGAGARRPLPPGAVAEGGGRGERGGCGGGGCAALASAACGHSQARSHPIWSTLAFLPSASLP